jgi:hypothetical protein
MTSGRYVVIAGETYPIGTMEQVAAAHRAMQAAGVSRATVLKSGVATGQTIGCPKAR